MKLTKEDYMCLPKERLAELLVERDEVDEIRSAKNDAPYVPAPPITIPYNPYTPWWCERPDFKITCEN